MPVAIRVNHEASPLATQDVTGGVMGHGQRRSIVEEARDAAIALVEREGRAAGGRMHGYERVAAQIGCSDRWLRRFVRRDPAAAVGLVVGLNILELHRR